MTCYSKDPYSKIFSFRLFPKANRLISPTDRTKPDAIRYHIIDIYYEELEKVLDDARLQSEKDDLDVPMEEINRPMTVVAKEGLTKILRNKAKEAMKEHELEMAAMAEGDEENDDEE